MDLEERVKQLEAELKAADKELHARLTAQAAKAAEQFKELKSMYQVLFEQSEKQEQEFTKKLPKLDSAKTTKAIEVLEQGIDKAIKLLKAKDPQEYGTFGRWIIGASRKTGGMRWVLTPSPNSSLKHSIPITINICPILEIISRLSLLKGDFKPATPDLFITNLKRTIGYDKGNPPKIGEALEPEVYEEFFDTYQFDHYVFWQAPSTSNNINRVAIALVFWAHTGKIPNPEDLANHMPRLTKLDLPPVKFAIGGYKDYQKNLEWEEKIEAYK